MVGVTPLPQQKDKAGVGIGTRMTFFTALVAIVGFVVVFKVLSFSNLRHEPVWATYGLVITGFIFMRFLLAWLYRPRPRSDGLPANGGDHRARLQRA